MCAAAAIISTQEMKIAKVKEHMGAIVTGIDLAQPIDAATQKKLYDAAVENVVLVICGQEHLTPQQLQAAGELFGELMEDQNGAIWSTDSVDQRARQSSPPSLRSGLVIP
jgi:alpha-ketoglutarate-dependent taurine dioxygenase